MSDIDEKAIFGTELSSRARLFSQCANYMVQGAVWGGAVFFGTLIVVWVLVQVGKILPEDSKNMPDPINRGAIEVPLEEVRAV